MGSGHWHPPVNPREIDPGFGIPGNHLVSVPTPVGKGERRLQGADGDWIWASVCFGGTPRSGGFASIRCVP